ncbi:MAG: DUF2202 domain-containing protein [Chlorobi bacterium]|nr:DUF2202 domain-containing protein [Chlorobiota bacterium]
MKKKLQILTAVLVILNFSSAKAYAQVTKTDKSSLLFMYEEEKLARDVYSAMSEKYTLPIFRNISKSENYHMSLIEDLIKKYNINNPASNKPKGEFINKDLQKLYNDLVNKGSISLNDAFEVGATIEDVDIHDLKKYVSKTENTDITRVFKQLTCGSRNHMRAFTRQINFTGITYKPQFISQNEYDKIINGKHERCFYIYNN